MEWVEATPLPTASVVTEGGAAPIETVLPKDSTSVFSSDDCIIAVGVGATADDVVPTPVTEEASKPCEAAGAAGAAVTGAERAEISGLGIKLLALGRTTPTG